MKDIVANRRRIGFGTKLRLGWIVLRENGVIWTLWFGLYYAGSAIADRAFTRMERRRASHGRPGLNSVRLNAEIWSRWDWSGGGEEWTPTAAWKVSFLENVLRKYIPEGVDILEIGPGAGRFTEHLLPRAKQYVGVDLSPSCVEVCRTKFADAPHARFLVNDGRSLAGIATSSIDAIWSFDVFVHVHDADVEAYFAEFARVLRPGGRGVVQHGTVGGARGGWRSNLTIERFNEIANRFGFEITHQFRTWEDGGEIHPVGLCDDAISVFERAASRSSKTPNRDN